MTDVSLRTNNENRPLIIGLTGGVGSGKSSVAARFAEHGVPIIDTDEIAHQLVAPGQPALGEIAERFGTEMLDAAGALDRTALREQVFADPAQRKALEAILHPRIRAESLRRIAALRTPYCVWVIPLLLETAAQADVDRVLVVDCPEWLQVQRVQARDRLAAETVARIMTAQTTRQERLASADDVILNDGDLSQLLHDVDAQHAAYTALTTRD